MISFAKEYVLCPLTSSLLVANMRLNELRKRMINGKTYKLVQKNVDDDSFFIVHPSAKMPGKIQATFFKDNNPYMDLIRDDMEQIIFELVQAGYTQVIKEV